MHKWSIGFLWVAVCGAQEVSSSPASQTKALEDRLNGIGRITWRVTTRDSGTGETTAPAEAWEELTHVQINAETCEMKAKWISKKGEFGATLFLEEFDNLEVIPAQEYLNRQHSLQKHPELRDSISPPIYSVLLGSRGDLKVRDRQAGEQIASALRPLVERCKVVPPPPVNTGASLQETLTFIEDKLNGQGPVTWMSTAQNRVRGIGGTPRKVIVDMSRVKGDAGNCRISRHLEEAETGKPAASFDDIVTLRRVDEVKLMTTEEANNTAHARGGHPEIVESIVPAISDVVVTGPGREWRFQFADQDLANRVAQAILHAARLCGGARQETF